MLKAEVAAEPASHENSAEPDAIQEVPARGLAGALEQLRQQGSQSRMGDDEEHCIKVYLEAKLEQVSCLKYWEKQHKEFGTHKVNEALCRLAR